MDEETERLIRQRAYALWQDDGCPEGRADEYWRRAEAEIMNQSVAGEEDPLAGVDDEAPGALASQIGAEPIQRSDEPTKGKR